MWPRDWNVIEYWRRRMRHLSISIFRCHQPPPTPQEHYTWDETQRTTKGNFLKKRDKGKRRRIPPAKPLRNFINYCGMKVMNSDSPSPCRLQRCFIVGLECWSVGARKAKKTSSGAVYLCECAHSSEHDEFRGRKTDDDNHQHRPCSSCPTDDSVICANIPAAPPPWNVRCCSTVAVAGETLRIVSQRRRRRPTTRNPLSSSAEATASVVA